MALEKTKAYVFDILIKFLREKHLDEIDSLLPSSTFSFTIADPVEIQDIFLVDPEGFESTLRQAILGLIAERKGQTAKQSHSTLKINLVDSRLIKLSEITDSSINSPILFDCSIIGMEPRESYIEKAHYQCGACGQVEWVDLTKDDLPKASIVCVHCQKTDSKDHKMMTFYDYKSKQNFVQKILIQEPETNNPLILWAEITKETVGQIELGIKKRILGVLRTQYKKETNRGKFLINVLSLQSLEDMKEATLTDDELNYYKEIAKDPDTYFKDYLIPSTASQLEGNELEKTFLLFSLVGGSDIGTYKSEINVLYAGDPSTGKSELLKFASFNLIQKGAYIDGPNASTAGLLYGLDEYEGKKILRAGAFVVNNGGHVVIDEFDKMNPIHRSSLNSTLGSGIAKYDKNGHNIETRIRTTLIAGCNPNNESWNDSLSVMDNLSPLEEPIINKFAVIICQKDRPHRDRDTRIIEHILKNFRDPNTAIIPPKIFKAILNHCRKRDPILSKEMEKYLAQTYVDFRQLEQDEKSLPIKTRQGIGLIQLSVAYAKLTFQDTVTKDIADKIISLYKETLKSLGMNTELGIVQSNLHGTAKDHKTAFLEIIRAATNEQGKFTEQQIKIAMDQNPHWKGKPDHAHVFWVKMERDSIIHHVKDGWYERV